MLARQVARAIAANVWAILVAASCYTSWDSGVETFGGVSAHGETIKVYGSMTT